MRFRALQQLRVPASSFSNLTTVRRLCASTQQSSAQAALNTTSSSSSSPLSENETASGEHVQQPQGPEAAQPAEDPGMAAAADGFEGSEKNLKGLWTAVKFALKGAILVGTVGAAYATYAFTPEQVEEKISALRHRQETTSNQDDSLLQKIQGVAYSTAAQAVASVAELYLETRKAVENQIKGFAAPPSDKLLPDLIPQEQHVFTIVLDLNETLVYSDWKRDRGWRTFKRPGVEAFLEHLAQYYELVLYTDQPSYIVDPMLEKLDKKGCIRYRLAREATQYVNGNHYRDLSKLNRNPARVIYVSAHPKETCLQPENAVPVRPWKLENDDTNLLDLLPFFEYVARNRPADIRTVLASYSGHDIPSEFRIRTKDYQRKMQELRFQNPFFKGSRSS